MKRLCVPSLGIEEKVAFLSTPAAYPDSTRHFQTIETHMSWVFLTDSLAWKLKKPVRYDYLDFSTSEARRRHCEEEVRLGSRLAPDVYRGVVPLTIDALGRLHLEGADEPIEWLVKMRRLPADQMLDRAIASGTASEADARKVGALLAGFYAHAPPVPITGLEYRTQLLSDILSSQWELARPEHALPSDLIQSVTAALSGFVNEEAELLDVRVRAGKIIEAHGDLRPEHICLETRPVIIDCLEFNRDFRILDSVSELSYLALECERLGALWVGKLILETYTGMTGDTASAKLLGFYRSFHACLRAKIALWHLKDPCVRDRAKWTDRASHYLLLCLKQLDQ